MAILRIDAVLNETGDRSKTSIYNRIKDGIFTKAVPIGQRIVGWPDHEVKTIVAAQIAGQTPDHPAQADPTVAARGARSNAEKPGWLVAGCGS